MSPASSRVITGRKVLIYMIAFFGVVFAVNAVMIKVALDTMPGLEVESAYRASLAFNGEAQAALAQAERAWRVDAHVERNAEGHATLRVAARDREDTPLTGLAFSARLAHPADKRLDRFVDLNEREIGVYRGAVGDLAAGRWDLVLEAERGTVRMFKSRDRIVLQ